MEHTDQSLARAEAAHYRAPEPQYVNQAELEAEKVSQLRKITPDDLRIGILEECDEQLQFAMHTGNAELIGLVVLKAMEVSAERRAMIILDLVDDYRKLKDVDKECAKVIAQWSLEHQGIKRAGGVL